MAPNPDKSQRKARSKQRRENGRKKTDKEGEAWSPLEWFQGATTVSQKESNDRGSLHSQDSMLSYDNSFSISKSSRRFHEKIDDFLVRTKALFNQNGSGMCTATQSVDAKEPLETQVYKIIDSSKGILSCSPDEDATTFDFDEDSSASENSFDDHSMSKMERRRMERFKKQADNDHATRREKARSGTKSEASSSFPTTKQKARYHHGYSIKYNEKTLLDQPQGSIEEIEEAKPKRSDQGPRKHTFGGPSSPLVAFHPFQESGHSKKNHKTANGKELSPLQRLRSKGPKIAGAVEIQSDRAQDPAAQRWRSKATKTAKNEPRMRVERGRHMPDFSGTIIERKRNQVSPITVSSMEDSEGEKSETNTSSSSQETKKSTKEISSSTKRKGKMGPEASKAIARRIKIITQIQQRFESNRLECAEELNADVGCNDEPKPTVGESNVKQDEQIIEEASDAIARRLKIITNIRRKFDSFDVERTFTPKVPLRKTNADVHHKPDHTQSCIEKPRGNLVQEMTRKFENRSKAHDVQSLSVESDSHAARTKHAAPNKKIEIVNMSAIASYDELRPMAPNKGYHRAAALSEFSGWKEPHERERKPAGGLSLNGRPTYTSTTPEDNDGSCSFQPNSSPEGSGLQRLSKTVSDLKSSSKMRQREPINTYSTSTKMPSQIAKLKGAQKNFSQAHAKSFFATIPSPRERTEEVPVISSASSYSKMVHGHGGTAKTGPSPLNRISEFPDANRGPTRGKGQQHNQVNTTPRQGSPCPAVVSSHVERTNPPYVKSEQRTFHSIASPQPSHIYTHKDIGEI